MNSFYQILLIILPLITAPYISRVLGSTGIGTYSFTVNVVQYFVIFSILGTITYGNREIAYYQNDKYKRSQIFWEINFLSWITSTVTIFLFIIFIMINNLNTSLYLWQGVAILTSMLDISWYFSGRERFSVIVLRNFIIKIVTVFCIFIFVKSEKDLIEYIAIMVISGLLGSLSLWPYLKSEIFIPELKKLNIFRHFKPTLILFLPTVAVTFYTLINKLLIGKIDSTVHLGFYSQADTILKMALSLLTALMTVMLPRISNMYANGDIKGIKKITRTTFNLSSEISIGISTGISAIALNFAPFFFGSQFKMVGPILMIESPLVIAISWNYIFGGQYLLPMNRMKIYTGSALFGAVTSIVLNLLIIPIFGVIGATVVTVISELAVCFYQLFNIRKEFELKPMFFSLWKYLISGVVMFGIVFWMNQAFQMTIVQLVLQIFVGISIYFILNMVLKTQLWLTFSEIINKIKK